MQPFDYIAIGVIVGVMISGALFIWAHSGETKITPVPPFNSIMQVHKKIAPARKRATGTKKR